MLIHYVKANLLKPKVRAYNQKICMPNLKKLISTVVNTHTVFDIF